MGLRLNAGNTTYDLSRPFDLTSAEFSDALRRLTSQLVTTGGEGRVAELHSAAANLTAPLDRLASSRLG